MVIIFVVDYENNIQYNELIKLINQWRGWNDKN